jgi:glycosyltransferase involved in cell wall biosynthesis
VSATRRPRELPRPPIGRKGWPWVPDAPSPLASAAPGPWPRITVVTPSYNQAEFLEQAIRSVLLQEYPNLEYIVVDGGSTDGSVGILERYSPWLDHWVSEPDRGQAHALNKGFARSTGTILCWLNSDDFHLPRTLRTVAARLRDGADALALVGHCLRIHHDGRPPLLLEGSYTSREELLRFWRGYTMHQPSIFWRRELSDRIGSLDESLDLIMDFDYWARMAEHAPFVTVDELLSCCTLHDRAKTADDHVRYHADLRAHASRYWGSRWSTAYWRREADMLNELVVRPRREAHRRRRAGWGAAARRLAAGVREPTG